MKNHVSLTVADPGFSLGGRQLSKWMVLTYYFAESCMKIKEVHKNILDRRDNETQKLRQLYVSTD